MKPRIMYVERMADGQGDDEADGGDGEAWIGRVTFSKTGRTIYYRARALQRTSGEGAGATYVDLETGDRYWASGVKRGRLDPRRARRGDVEVDADAREEYDRLMGG